MNRLKHWLKLISVITAASALMVLALNEIVMPLYTRHYDEIKVPDLTGLTLTAAQSKLGALDLAQQVRYQYNRQAVKHTVMSQSPEPGSSVKKGRVIRLTVSEDEQIVSVPQLKLTTLRDADFILESSGLKAGKTIHQASDEFPSGIIIGQSIEAGAKIQTGTPVDLVISSGRIITNVKVPYLINKSLTEVKSVIADSSLKLGTILKRYSPDLLPGTVIAQLPDSGVTVSPYSEVQITISSTDQADKK